MWQTYGQSIILTVILQPTNPARLPCRSIFGGIPGLERHQLRSKHARTALAMAVVWLVMASRDSERFYNQPQLDEPRSVS